MADCCQPLQVPLKPPIRKSSKSVEALFAACPPRSSGRPQLSGETPGLGFLDFVSHADYAFLNDVSP
jgi:hypothetical protein